MKMLARAALALSAMLAYAPAIAVPIIPHVQNQGGFSVPAYEVQEQLVLAAANVASAPAVAFGGNYVFSQICTGYGTAALDALGPDLATYEILISKTQPDATGGTAVTLQGGSTVKAVLTGTTGCNVTLTRVP